MSFAIRERRLTGTLAGTQPPPAREMGIDGWFEPCVDQSCVPASVTVAMDAPSVGPDQLAKLGTLPRRFASGAASRPTARSWRPWEPTRVPLQQLTC
jgi:hypothetical protein